MRWLKIILFLLLIVALQTVLFARLNFFGAAPDLLLVAVIIAAVLDQGLIAVVFAAAAGLVQDVLAVGHYYNLFTKSLIAGSVTLVRQSFLSDEYSLIAGLVAMLTPLSLLLELAWSGSGQGFALVPVLIKTLLTTFYNLIMVPLLLPLARRVFHG